MFWLLGIPAAALWGLVTVFASMVPFVGTAGVWVPGTVYLLMTGAWPQAVVLAVWGAAVVSSVDNFLRPRLVAGRVRLSGVAMFVAMLGGLQAFGVLGIILGPVVFATAAAIVDVLRDTDRHTQAGLPRLSRRRCDRLSPDPRQQVRRSLDDPLTPGPAPQLRRGRLGRVPEVFKHSRSNRRLCRASPPMVGRSDGDVPGRPWQERPEAGVTTFSRISHFNLHLDLNAQFHDALGRQAEECRRAHRIPRHQHEQFLPPDRHSLPARHDDRLAAEEIR
jgi:hypothetical protein